MMFTRDFLRGCGPLMAGVFLASGVSIGQAADTAESPWSVEASIGLEYDDNLTIEELDEVSGEEDFAAVIDFSVAYAFPGLSDYEVEAGYDFYQSLYNDFSEYNLQSHGLNLSGSREFGDLDVSLGYRYTLSFLDGDDFLQLNNIRPAVGYSVLPNWYLNAGYSYMDKDFDQYPDRSGDQQALTLDNYIVFNENMSYVRLGYRYEDEDADGPQYDYTGDYFNAVLSTPLTPVPKKTKVELSYQYFDKDYSKASASEDTGGAERSDYRHTLGLKTLTNLSEDLFASFKYEYIDANSNLPSADYNENIVTISLGRNW